MLNMNLHFMAFITNSSLLISPSPYKFCKFSDYIKYWWATSESTASKTSKTQAASRSWSSSIPPSLNNPMTMSVISSLSTVPPPSASKASNIQPNLSSGLSRFLTLLACPKYDVFIGDKGGILHLNKLIECQLAAVILIKHSEQGLSHYPSLE